jgi:hypothetical protein
MTDGLWWTDNETEEQVENDLETVRNSMTEEDRVNLAAFMLDGIEPKQTHKTGPTSTANSGEGEAPANDEGQRSSTQVLDDFRSGRVYPNDPDAARGFFTARLREAQES